MIRLIPRSTSTATSKGKDALVTPIDWIFGKHESDRQKALVQR